MSTGNDPNAQPAVNSGVDPHKTLLPRAAVDEAVQRVAEHVARSVATLEETVAIVEAPFRARHLIV